MADRSVRVILSAVTAQYQAAMAKARAAAAGFGSDLQKAGSTMSRVGTTMSNAGATMTRRVSLPLVALGAGAVKTAIDFETAFTGVRKTIDATEKQYRELETGIKDMAERLPASVEEISAVAEAAGQLGIQRENILGFTKTMIDLGETTNLTADTAATSLARLANITKMPQDEFDRLGATIVDLGNKGASTEAEITEMSLRIAGAGAQIGLSEAQILGFAESLSSVGINAEAGGSAISRVFITMASEIEKGKAGLDNFAKVAGMSASEFASAFERDAAGAMIAFIDGLGKMKKEGGDVFGTLEKLELNEIRVRDALLRASGAGDLFAESQKTAAKAWRENNALSEEANKRYKTTAAQLEVLKNKFRNILARFGKDMMPVLKDAADALADVAKWFSDLDPEMRKNILKWGALAIAAGPFVRILGSITKLGGGAASIIGKILAARAIPAPAPGAPAPGVPPVAGGLGAGTIAVGVAATAIAAGKGLEHLTEDFLNAEDGADRFVESQHAITEAIRSGEMDRNELDEFVKRWNESVGKFDEGAKVSADRVWRLARAHGSSQEAVEAYNRVMKNASGLTFKQKEKVGTLIDAMVKLTGSTDELAISQAANLIAAGDLDGALKILKGSIDETYGKTKNLGAGFDDAGADAEEAALKADHFKRSLDAIPSTKTVRITVYQDTVSREIIRRVTETGSGRGPELYDPNVQPTRGQMSAYAPAPSLAGDFTVSGVLEVPGFGPAILKGARITVDAATKRQGRTDRARTSRVA